MQFKEVIKETKTEKKFTHYSLKFLYAKSFRVLNESKNFTRYPNANINKFLMDKLNGN